jgi:hypothetical protein
MEKMCIKKLAIYTMKKNTNITYHGCSFLVWRHGQEFYRAAAILREAKNLSAPYYICLSFSIELFIKCLYTTTEFKSATNVKLSTLRSRKHLLSELFNKLPEDMKSDCERIYSEKHTRSLVKDIEHISDVFVKYRYLYEDVNDHNIPDIFVKYSHRNKDIKTKKIRELCIDIIENIGAFFDEYSTKVGNFSQALE